VPTYRTKHPDIAATCKPSKIDRFRRHPLYWKFSFSCWKQSKTIKNMTVMITTMVVVVQQQQQH